MSFLFSPEALDLMSSHRLSLSSNLWHALNKTNHSFIAVGVEFVVVSGFKRHEFLGAVLSWILGDLWLDSILEVSQESHAVLEFHLEGLIVDGGPGTCDILLGAVFAAFAEFCFGLELIHQLDSVGIFRLEQPLMVIIDHLKPIQQKL
jgi:hypothetical protein